MYQSKWFPMLQLNFLPSLSCALKQTLAIFCEAPIPECTIMIRQIESVSASILGLDSLLTALLCCFYDCLLPESFE